MGGVDGLAWVGHGWSRYRFGRHAARRGRTSVASTVSHEFSSSAQINIDQIDDIVKSKDQMMSLPNVSPHLTIRILYSDDDVVVIEKPCDLRSVPGHAKPSPRSGGGGDADASSQSHRRTAQEAWVTAIQLMSEAYELDDIPTKSIVAIPGDIIIDNEEVSIEDSAVKELLHNLGSTANPSCVPRKMETFVKYCHRNSKRLLPSFPDLHPDKSKNSIVSKKEQCDEPTPQKKQKCDKSSKPSGKDEVSSTMRKNAQLCYAKIQQTQIPLMNLPKPTEDWESAIGQLRMMGFGDYNHCASTTANEDSGKSSDAKLHVVHRLDCQVSQTYCITCS